MKIIYIKINYLFFFVIYKLMEKFVEENIKTLLHKIGIHNYDIKRLKICLRMNEEMEIKKKKLNHLIEKIKLYIFDKQLFMEIFELNNDNIFYDKMDFNIKDLDYKFEIIDTDLKYKKTGSIIKLLSKCFELYDNYYINFYDNYCDILKELDNYFETQSKKNDSDNLHI